MELEELERLVNELRIHQKVRINVAGMVKLFEGNFLFNNCKYLHIMDDKNIKVAIPKAMIDKLEKI